MSQRYATVDASGVLTGFFRDGDGPVPAGAVPITDAIWQAWLADFTGQAWVDGALTPYTPAAPGPGALPVTIAAAAYLARFDEAETTAIHTAALAQPPTAASLQLFGHLLLIAAAGSVTLTDAAVVAGHAGMVAQGLLTAGRSTAILTP